MSHRTQYGNARTLTSMEPIRGSLLPIPYIVAKLNICTFVKDSDLKSLEILLQFDFNHIFNICIKLKSSCQLAIPQSVLEKGLTAALHNAFLRGFS